MQQHNSSAHGYRPEARENYDLRRAPPTTPLELSKLALVDFAHCQSQKSRLISQLPQREVKPVTNTKYPGVFFNQSCWNLRVTRDARSDPALEARPRCT